MKAQFFPYKDENVTKGLQYVSISLIIVNTLIFLITVFDLRNIIAVYGFIPASFTVTTIFTSMFLHGSVSHLFGNMWFLYIYGDNVEEKFGSFGYLLFYLGSGIVATFFHWLTNPSSVIPAVGASGAISGVLGAYLVLFPKVKIRAIGPFYMIYRIPVTLMIGFWFAMQLFFGFITLASGVGGGIAFFAHIGGFVFGYIVTKMYKRLGYDKNRLLRLGIFENRGF